MKTFYGETFIDKNKLEEANIFNPIKLEYYKIKDNKQYGIEVVKKEYTKERTLVESKKMDNVTKDENVVNKVLNLFCRNDVTPISAKDILDDLLLDVLK